MLAARSAAPAMRGARGARGVGAIRYASTETVANQAKAGAYEAAGSAKGAAKEAVGEAKGAASNLAGSAKGAAHEAKAAVTPSAPIVVGAPTIRRPVGSVRGGIMGFLFGFGLASGYGYYYLLKEYNAASNLMLASVEELQGSTEKITGHLQRLNKLEADLKSLSSNSALKSDYEKNRVDMKKIVDGLHDEVLDIKKRVLDLPRPTKYMEK